MSDIRTRAASRDLSAVRPSWSEAMHALAPETVAALVRRVSLAARQYPRADEVESLAAVMVAGFYSDNVDRAASAACRAASRVVSQAYAGVDSLDLWADVAPDMVESCAARTDVATGLPHAWSPAPDGAYVTTDADVVAAAIATLTGDARRVLTDAARAYVAHGSRRCSVCESANGMGRRVALAGILAHTRRLTASDSEYHALRRQTLAALRAVDVAAVKAEHFYPRPSLGRASVSLDRAPVVAPPSERERAARSLPRTDLVTVTSADGTRLTRTEEHYAALRSARTADDIRAEQVAGAPSGAVRAPQRKRSGGTGAYGSQVPARLSRG